MRLRFLTDLRLKPSLRQITSWTIIALAALAVCVTFGQVSPAAAVLAQSASEIKLELIPASVELPVKGESEVQLVLRNHTENTLEGVRLDWFTNTNVSITPLDAQDVKLIAPRSESVWRLKLKHGEEGLVSGKINFRISYGLQAGNTASVAQVVFGSLEVKGREADAVEKMAEVVVKTSITSLNEQHPGRVYLVINNKSDQEIRIGKLSSSGPTFIQIEPELTGIQKVAPHDSLGLPVNIRVTDAVDPGKQLVLFRIPIEWGTGEQLQSASLVASQEFNIGVFGESEILTALGIPSFLILPGFLMLISYRMFSNLGREKKREEESSLKIGTSPQFWMIAITLSIFMALLYPAITGLVGGVRRNYLGSYGLNDVVRVWFISIIFGALACGVVYSFRRLQARYYTPSENDNPIKIIKKLRWQRLSIHLPTVEVKRGQENMSVFRIQARKGNQKTFWVAPYIDLSWREGVDSNFKGNVALQMERGKSISDLIDSLEQEDKLTLQWDKTGIITQPYFISEDEFTGIEAGEQPIIRIKEEEEDA